MLAQGKVRGPFAEGEDAYGNSVSLPDASTWRTRSLHFWRSHPPTPGSGPPPLESQAAYPLRALGLQVENQAHEQGNFAVWEKEGQEQMQKDMAQRMKGLQSDNQK